MGSGLNCCALSLEGADGLARQAAAVGVVSLADWMAVVGMRVPLHPQAAVNMAVVLAEEQVQRACESRDQGDVGKRTADEVVTAVRRLMDQVAQAGEGHAATLTTPSEPAGILLHGVAR